MKNIKKYSLFVLIVSGLIWAGCAATRTTASKYVGNWSYLVKNLPDGDVKGIMSISQSGEDYIGDIKSDDGNMTIKMESLKIEGDKLSAYFNYQGMKIYLDGRFTDTDFSGKVSVDYNEFPITAQKIN